MAQPTRSTAESGNDTLIGGAGADTLIGGLGTDTASYASSGAGVTVNLQTGSGSGGDAQGDTLSGIENITGSAFADMLTGDGGANTLVGGAGPDALNGGGGTDTADYSSSAMAVNVNLLANSGAGGDAQGDTFSSIENIIGSAFADMLTGDSGANTIDGRSGNDTLIGGAGADALIGGAGTDTADYSSSAAGVTVSLQTGLRLGWRCARRHAQRHRKHHRQRAGRHPYGRRRSQHACRRLGRGRAEWRRRQ